MMACISIMGLSVIMWTTHRLLSCFCGNHGGILGDFRWAALNGVGWEAGPYSDTIPHLVFAAFQMMFAMITPALITGAVVGRMKFKALFAFIALWSVIVYYPMAHMVWGEGGFLASIGFRGLCRRKCGTYQFRCECSCTCNLSRTQKRL